MRRIERSSAFKKDFKRVLKRQRGAEVEGLLREALSYLLNDRPLPAKYKDPPLTGNWTDFRDCHLRPDLVLIYRLEGDEVLQLTRLGSHSDLSL
jgi:mRNA interferase YafQ